jgi:hypothetical protein
MPKRTDLQSILILASGPIVIGQAAEFDYSGTQAVRALREEGYRVILVNSNPATIMTDPDLADATYIESITPSAASFAYKFTNALRTYRADLLRTNAARSRSTMVVRIDDSQREAGTFIRVEKLRQLGEADKSAVDGHAAVRNPASCLVMRKV